MGLLWENKEGLKGCLVSAGHDKEVRLKCKKQQKTVVMMCSMVWWASPTYMTKKLRRIRNNIWPQAKHKKKQRGKGVKIKEVGANGKQSMQHFHNTFSFSIMFVYTFIVNRYWINLWLTAGGSDLPTLTQHLWMCGQIIMLEKVWWMQVASRTVRGWDNVRASQRLHVWWEA